MGVDHGSDAQEIDRLQRQVRNLNKAFPNGSTADSQHPGTGAHSIQIGEDTDSFGDYSVSLGQGAHADSYGLAVGVTAWAGESGASFGYGALAGGANGLALGTSADANYFDAIAIGWTATAAADHDFVLGNANHTIRVQGDLTVSGTFSNPSARRLKMNIIPAPDLTSIFPELVEYEYIDKEGRRRLGYIADDLVGTDAERFVKFDDDGQPLAIDYLTLLIAQNAQLHARLTALESKEA